MRRIAAHRKTLGVDKTADLKSLKSAYRNLMKESHPDKFMDDEAAKEEAEERSKKVIEAYHFLVSIAPETIEQALPEYTETVTNSQIQYFEYKKEILELNFVDGSSYEYFGVPKTLYTKLCGSDVPDRFCRRHIYHEFTYRKMTKAVEAE